MLAQIPKINRLNQPYMHMENIKFFLDACKALGMQNRDIFDTSDLYEAQLLRQVSCSVA